MKIIEKKGSFDIVDFDEFEAWYIAAKIEKDGTDFYQKLKSQSRDEEVQKAVEFLLGEEKKHLAFFQEQIDQLRQVKEDTAEEDDLLTSINYGIFQPFANMDDISSIISNPRKALKLGIRIEEKSIDFYQMCLARVTAPDTKTQLVKILEEEKKHKALFEGLLEKLQKI